ncbi:MAG: glutathione S-transferase family protein [Rhodobacteraceae bacterium]|nr:glutathione S-transferase family protein [Paracoccaceae bacterium]
MPSAPDQPTLYHSEISFFSQIARLALTEKNVTYNSVVLAITPPVFENFEPWYLDINANATVPSLQVGDRIFTDAEHYLYKIDRLFKGPLLAGSNRIATGNWVIRALALQHRDIVALRGANKFLTLLVNRKRLKRLYRLKSQHPDFTAQYTAKIAEVKDYSEAIKDPRNAVRVNAQFHAALDAINKVLASSPHISEENYTIADIVWTAIVSRQMLLNRAPFANRPNLAEWFSRMQARPSYNIAGIQEKFSLGAKMNIFLGLWR